MGRALLSLLAGVVAAVLIGAWISPMWTWREALLPVLVTGGIGAMVLAVAGRRAALRDRAQALADLMNAREAAAAPSPAPDTIRTDGQEADRG